MRQRKKDELRRLCLEIIQVVGVWAMMIVTLTVVSVITYVVLTG